jgi:pSer/pThr/pTyr-binding forkhead associated (FHA) protein
VIGRGDGDLQFPDDPFMSGRHARVIYRGGSFFVQDNNSRNGTFLRVRGEEPVRNGDMFLVGSQLLRVECGARPEQGHLRVIFHDGATGERFPLRRQRTVIGRHEGDITFPADASLAEAHAFVDCRDDGLVLVDGGSRNGSFLRVQTEAEVHDGDLVIVGQHIFRFENDVEVGLG